MRAPLGTLAALGALTIGSCADPTRPVAPAMPAFTPALPLGDIAVDASPTFVVTSTIDAVDAVVGDGVCAVAPLTDGTAPCTLRGAIQEANALSGPQTVALPAGTYPLTIPNPTFAPSGVESGGLDITDAVTISGAGVAATVIDCVGPAGCSLSGGEMFPIHAGAVVIAGVTLARTNPDPFLTGAAGAVRVYPGASLLLSAAAVRTQRSGTGGAGILNQGTLTLDHVTLAGNAVLGVGGGLNNAGTATIVASTFSGNSTGIAGAAIFNSGTLGLTNSTLSDNVASGPGVLGPAAALYNVGTATLNSVTIAGNTTPTVPTACCAAGGVANVGAAAVLRMSNSILSGNTSYDCDGTIASLGHNVIQNPEGCTVVDILRGNLIGVDPQLAPLADNGGSTLTRALLPGSPAIDAGNGARGRHDSTACPRVDQRDLPRRGRCDIGAFEVQR